MDIQMGGWMYGCIEGLADGWREGQRDGITDTYIYTQVEGLWMNGWHHRRMDRHVVGQTD